MVEDPAVEAEVGAHALALEIVGLAGKDRFARQRVAAEADVDAGDFGEAHHRLGLGLDRADEGLAAAERAMADPAGRERRGEADQEFEPGRHRRDNSRSIRPRQPCDFTPVAPVAPPVSARPCR